MYTSKHLCHEWIISGSSVFSLVYMWVYVLLSRRNYLNIQFEALFFKYPRDLLFWLLFLFALDDLVYFLVQLIF